MKLSKPYLRTPDHEKSEKGECQGKYESRIDKLGVTKTGGFLVCLKETLHGPGQKAYQFGGRGITRSAGKRGRGTQGPSGKVGRQQRF